MVKAPPLSREARKAQTREAIVAAATDLFATHGIEATSLDRIAQEVGLTKGAIYSTFSSKDELVEAVALATSVTVDPDYLTDPQVPLRDGLRKLGAEIMAASEKLETNAMILHLEITLYERRHRTWGDRVGSELRAEIERFAERLDAAVKARRERLPIPALEFGYALRALAFGIVVELEQNPKAITKESVMDLFEASAG